MFRLAHQVRCDDGRIRRAVGDDADLRRAGEDIDAHAAEQHALGFGHELVAGTDDYVGRLAGEQAIGHGGNGLHAAQGHDGVHARHLHGVQHLRMDALAAIGRGAGDDRGHAGRLGGGDAHVGRRDVRIAPGGHVAARHIDRNQPLPGHQPRRQFDLEFPHRCHLRLRELAHLAGRELDVALDARRNGRGAPFDFGGGHQDVPLPFVQPPGVVAHRSLAAGLDVRQHFRGDLARGGLVALGLLRRGFELVHCHRFGLG